MPLPGDLRAQFPEPGVQPGRPLTDPADYPLGVVEAPVQEQETAVHGHEPLFHPLQAGRGPGDHGPQITQCGPDVTQALLDTAQPRADGTAGRILGSPPPMGRLLDVEEVRADPACHVAVAQQHRDVEHGATGEQRQVGAPLWITRF